MVGAQDACNNLIVEGVLGQSGSEDRHRREEGIPFPPFTQVSESSQTCLSLSLSLPALLLSDFQTRHKKGSEPSSEPSGFPEDFVA